MNIEQRQKYYEHLCGQGFPEIIAASMAAQTDDLYSSDHKQLQVAIFAYWNETTEGSEFWSAIFDCLE